ncbi:claudin-16-like [Salarias fasciatus]|uniref:claudin-16-like n=1 Tax=Salarias fasciatus TaxID=181472 RepID=UPI0011766D94|nr:claudin-16-like [Salarias fasciatus]
MSGVQGDVPGLLMAAASLLLLAAAAGKDCWREGAKDALSSVGLSWRCRGLWGECVYDGLVGLRTCDVSPSYMETLPAALLAMRLSLLGMGSLCVSSVLVLVPALDCVRLLSSRPEGRRLLLLQVSGALCLCGGVCGAVGLLWYGVETYSRYTLEAALHTPGITFEFGASYWLLLGSEACCLTSATLTLRSWSRFREAVRTRAEPQRQPDVPAAPPPASSFQTYI